MRTRTSASVASGWRARMPASASSRAARVSDIAIAARSRGARAQKLEVTGACAFRRVEHDETIPSPARGARLGVPKLGAGPR